MEPAVDLFRAQELPEPIALPERAFDLSGQVFGELKALRPVGTGQRGVSWLCECECGRHAIRSAAALRQSVRDERTAQCSECLRELRGGTIENKRSYWHERFLLMWARDRRLYSDAQLDAMQRQIEDNLREFGLEVPEPADEVDDAHDAPQVEPYEAMSDGEDFTLKEVGLTENCSQERVRQIEASAIWALMAGKTGMLLRELLTGDVTMRPARAAPVLFTGGCKCRRFASVLTGRIYCQTCGQVWSLDDGNIRKLLTRQVLERVRIVSDEEMDRNMTELHAKRAAEYREQPQGRPERAADREQVHQQSPGDVVPLEIVVPCLVTVPLYGTLNWNRRRERC